MLRFDNGVGTEEEELDSIVVDVGALVIGMEYIPTWKFDKILDDVKL